MRDLANRFQAHNWRAALHRLTLSHGRAVMVLAIISLCFFLPGQMSLQPMDRDEPRFAQASKQMLETGDYIDIRFQAEARHKKPVGIYWLQAGSVSLGKSLGVADAERQIWLYRLPSLLGAVAMVLLTYWAGLAFLSREGAMLAALMMAASVLLGVEARLAKTDALLGAFSVASMGFLARAYLAMKAPGIAPALESRHLVMFWVVIGASVLLKGPITPFVALLAILALAIRDRGARWVFRLRPLLGLLIVALVVLPWFTMILLEHGDGFIRESLGKDMLAKVGSAQEKHGAPPGTYLGVFWVTFWPAAPLAVLALAFIWRERRDDGVAFLLAWILPFWLVLEAVPTKLPHYVLPVYPAIAILIMLAIERGGLVLSAALRWLSAVLLLLVPLVFLIGAPAIFLVLEEGLSILRLPFFAFPFLALAMLLGIGAAYWLVKSQPLRALVLGVAASAVLTIAAYPFGMPMLKAINLSPRLADAARATGCESPAFATLGYREPSLVFLTDTTLMMGTAQETAEFMEKPGAGCRIAFVERAFEAEFRNGLTGSSAPALVTRVRGVNLNAALDKQRRLRVLDLAVYVRR
ncbi:ArnT 4-amino-4-deoxy-L-arabinose transferase and related glycosyltransferases of PMT family [Rhabdaerophilaceae bacterium]